LFEIVQFIKIFKQNIVIKNKKVHL